MPAVQFTCPKCHVLLQLPGLIPRAQPVKCPKCGMCSVLNVPFPKASGARTPAEHLPGSNDATVEIPTSELDLPTPAKTKPLPPPRPIPLAIPLSAPEQIPASAA